VADPLKVYITTKAIPEHLYLRGNIPTTSHSPKTTLSPLLDNPLFPAQSEILLAITRAVILVMKPMSTARARTKVAVTDMAYKALDCEQVAGTDTRR
jgi:hypothetical protein